MGFLFGRAEYNRPGFHKQGNFYEFFRLHTLWRVEFNYYVYYLLQLQWSLDIIVLT